MSGRRGDADLLVAVRATTGWDDARARHALQEYDRFLTLWREDPTQPLVPCADVDRVWHADLAGGRTGVPPHVVRDDLGQALRFASTQRRYAERWGAPGALWDTVGPCQTDAPQPDPLAPEDPPPDPARGLH